MGEQDCTREPLPIDVIMAAIGGDEKAMRTVVRHYGGYINALSTRRLYDDDGRQYLFIDDELRHELELKLITRIVAFNAKAA
jgi:hypothetical protein